MFLLINFVLLIYNIDNKGCSAGESFCELGEFRCSGGSSNDSGSSDADHVCVPQVNICDGIEDCPNASDEQDCGDRNLDLKFDQMFRKNPHAEHDDLNQTCLLNYSGTCFCRHKDILCHYHKLMEVPRDLPEDIVILDFTGNNFQILTNRTFGAIRKVGILVMRHCDIEEIFPYTFYNLNSTEVLHLDNNKIKEIPNHLFHEENNLEILYVMDAAVTL